MKKSILSFVAVLSVSAFLFTSCGGGEAQNNENNEAEETEVTTSGSESNQVEADAKRMAELACESQALNKKAQEDGLTPEEIKTLNEPLNAQMTEINDRFNAEYANTEKQTEFQNIFQTAFQACSGN